MSSQPREGQPLDRTAVADYVAALSTELAAMAHRTGLETLCQLLEMVRLEAENAGSGRPPRRY